MTPSSGSARRGRRRRSSRLPRRRSPSRFCRRCAPARTSISPGPLDESFNAAIHRAAERSRPKDGTRNSCVLSFFGVKGGAGTTTIAVNTAIEIARTSKKPTLIIDLHQFIGEVALFLGVRPRFTLVDALDNLHRIDAEFLRELVVKHKTGLDILAGGEQADRPGPQDARHLRTAAADAGPQLRLHHHRRRPGDRPVLGRRRVRRRFDLSGGESRHRLRAQRASRRRSHGAARRRQGSRFACC